MTKVKHSHQEPTVHVKGRNMTVTPALHDQVVNKLARLEKYHDRVQTIEVELHTEKTREAAYQNYVEATAHVRGKTLRVSATHEDMHAAIDEVVDKLYRQLNRQKERLKSHHAGKLAEILPEQPTEDEGRWVDESSSSGSNAHSGPVAVHVERLDVEAQFEEEAIQEMEALGHEFHVFLNARNERMSVLYKRRAGGYGVIEPHVAR